MTDTPLISTGELADLLDDPTLRIVDGSWHLDGRDARADFDRERLPGAVFFDLEAVSDHSSELPHMLPTAAAFAGAVGALGITETDTIVVYDTVGLRSAPRVWWTFRLMGATNLRVLDGGLPRWRDEGRPLDTNAAQTPTPARFTPSRRSGAVADLPTVLAALTGEAQILDARPAARFAGVAAEPRAGLRSGHMPGAVNVPFPSVLGEDGRLLEREALRARLAEAGVAFDRPIITSCGSGVTAAILTLALAQLGEDSALYDGSWAEWGGRSDTEVVTGP
ncbi:3-mercaptopyruvate sulfurtransferase [Brevundimonas sp. R86498]|uniref:3-mercaptopyruvate sulfurtransferase n=1 Tax=Brevundimonas sp. R86498 TaxID=3093845 RepID=UPI0037CC9B91